MHGTDKVKVLVHGASLMMHDGENKDMHKMWGKKVKQGDERTHLVDEACGRKGNR